MVGAGRIEEVRRLVGGWAEQPALLRDYLWTSMAVVRAQLWLQLGDQRALSDLRAALAPYTD